MSVLTVYDMKGAATGEVEFPDALILMDRGDQVVHDGVVAEMAARRAGTASTLAKGAVSGTGAKPWRQKGTGRARAGYKQSPVWRGGGVAFGPHPRDFSVKVNRKAARLALQRAFSEKLAAGSVKVVENIAVDEPKTKTWTSLMKALDVSAPALFVLGEIDANTRLASRNIARIETVRADSVGLAQLLRYPTIVADRSGLATIQKRFAALRRGDRRQRGSVAEVVGNADVGEEAS